MLTQEQLIMNIDAMKQQGASDADIQGYLDSLKTQQAQIETQLGTESSTQAIPSEITPSSWNPTEHLGKGLAGIMTQPYIRSLEPQTSKTNQLLLRQLRVAQQKGDTQTVNRITKLLQQVTQPSPMETVSRELPTSKQVIGSALSTLGTIGAFGTYGPAAAGLTTGRLGTARLLNTLPAIGSRIGTMTTAGGLTGAGGALEQGKTGMEVVKSGIIGAGTGLVVSGVLEGVGALSRAVAGTKVIQKEAGKVYTSELQPPRKELAQQIERGFKTFGQQVSEVVDNTGKPVYIGTYDTLLSEAKNELSTKGKTLNEILSSFPEMKIGRNEVVQDIIKRMENVYGKLSSSQIRQINFEISRMPKNFDILKLEEIKRMYDKLIPDSFWSKIGDSAVNFISTVKYILRDNTRKLINEKAGEMSAGVWSDIIQKLNNEMGIAMDVKSLVSNQIAQRQLWKISGQGGFFYKMIGKFIDDYLLNPAVTTRYAQTLRTLGTKTGQTFLRQLSRLGITQGATRTLTNQ